MESSDRDKARIHNRSFTTSWFPSIPEEYRGKVHSSAFLNKKTFVPETLQASDDVNNSKSQQELDESLKDVSNGRQVKTFYSDIVSKPSSNPSKSTFRTKSTVKTLVGQQSPSHSSLISSSSTSTRFWCETCNDFVTQNLDDHLRSIVHLVEDSSHPSKHYFLSESNKGYQILKYKMNWTEEQGLGANNQGRLDPIPSQLRSDRKGLGSSGNLDPKVTHFKANDISAVQRKTIVKLQPKKKKLKHLRILEKQKEDMIREEIFR